MDLSRAVVTEYGVELVWTVGKGALLSRAVAHFHNESPRPIPRRPQKSVLRSGDGRVDECDLPN